MVRCSHKGRERIYLDRFWNELSANPKAIDEATRRHYAKLYARSGAMHSAFNQFAAFTQDAIDNKALAANGKLTMPVLALGADHSFGAQMAEDVRFVATNVTGGIITDWATGSWKNSVSRQLPPLSNLSISSDIPDGALLVLRRNDV